MNATPPWLTAVCALLLAGSGNATTPLKKQPKIAGYKLPLGDIYLMRFVRDKGNLRADKPTNITKATFRYDNQPHFTPDSRGLLYTSMRDGKQTDIYRYDLISGLTRQLTATPESEFSPTVMADGRQFSSVLIESDKKKTQRLWRFPLGGGKGRLILPKVTDVGYHTWISGGKLLLFIVGKPHKLIWADPVSGATKLIALNPGRSLHRHPDGKGALFVDQGDPLRWVIRYLDTTTLATRPIVTTLPKSEDFTVLPDGTLLAAMGPAIYRYTPGKDKHWVAIAAMKKWGIASIGRLTVSKDQKWLAFVAK